MSQKRKLLAVVLFLFTFNISLCSASPTIYSGSLNNTISNGGLTGNAAWASGVTFSWTVSLADNSSLWHYQYILNIPAKSLSHFIIETSSDDDFSNADIQNVVSTTVSQDDDTLPMLYGPQGTSNVGIPESFFGVKFGKDVDPSNLTYTVDFDSTRVPVWGDFYAKDGKDGGADVYIFNNGFTVNDTDPTVAASNGSVGYHILRPDSECQPTIPAPAALILASVGIGFVGFLRRRHMV